MKMYRYIFFDLDGTLTQSEFGILEGAKRALTRGDDNGGENDDDEETEYGNSKYSPKDEDTDVLTSKKKSARIFTLNMKKLEKLPTIGPILKKQGIKFSLIGYYHEKTTIRHIQKCQDGNDYVKDVYDETPSYEFQLKAGWVKTGNSDEKLKPAFERIYKGISESEFAQKHDISASNFMLHIPVPATAGALEFFIRITPRITVELGILGEAIIEKNLGTIHKEVEYIDGRQGKNVFKINQSEDEGWEFKKFDYYGTFSVKGSVEILVGAATLKGSFGLGAGFEFGADLTLKADEKTNLNIVKNLNGIDPKSSYVKFDLFFNPKIKAFGLSPAGTEWGSIEFDIPGVPSHISLVDKTMYFYPQVGDPRGNFVVGVDGIRTVANITASYKIPEMNIYGYMNILNYCPAVAIYRINQRKNTEKLLETVHLNEYINKTDRFEFTYTDQFYEPGCYYKAVPVIYNQIPGTPNVVYGNNGIPCMEVEGDSEMKYLDIFQYKYELTEDENGEDTEIWQFVVKIHISNLSNVKKWKEWGVKISLDELDDGWKRSLDFDGNPLTDVKFRVTKNIKKNTVALKFTIISYPGNQFKPIAHPYYIDEDGFEMEYTHPYYYTDEDEEDFFSPWEAKGAVYLNKDMETWGNGDISSSDQVIDMGGI